MRFATPLTIILLICAIQQSAGARPGDGGRQEDFRRSVVLIRSNDQQKQPLALGSGFFVGDGKTIVTNYRMIRGARFVRFQPVGGKLTGTKIVSAVDPEYDLALLTTPTSGKPLPLFDGMPGDGAFVAAFGSSEAGSLVDTVGDVTFPRGKHGHGYRELTNPISPLLSGGPVFDAKGNVVGMSSIFANSAAGRPVLIPAARIRHLMENRAPVKLSRLARRNPSAPGDRLPAGITVEDRAVGNGTVAATVTNTTGRPLSSLRLVAVFVDREAPARVVHTVQIEDAAVIPHGKSRRVAGSQINIQAQWKVSFRVLDYRIEEQPSSRDTTEERARGPAMLRPPARQR